MYQPKDSDKCYGCESLAKRIAELDAACEMKDKRIDWTVKDNAKKAIEIERLRAENEQQADVIHQIKQWCQAYPRDIFIPPTEKQWARVNEVLEADEGCPSSAAISGSNMCHVVEGIQQIIDKAALGDT